MYISKIKSECGIAQLGLPLIVLFSCCSIYVDLLELILLNELNEATSTCTQSVAKQFSHTYNNLTKGRVQKLN